MSLIVVTRLAADDARYRCRVCGALFGRDLHDAYERHVVSCAGANEAELRARSLRNIPLFNPETFDTEFEAWVARNANAILEGRRKLK